MEHLQFLTAVGRYATPEVMTVLGALFTAWVGWKVAAKSFGLISGMAQKVSFIGLVAAVLCISGLGSVGLGIGEVAYRWFKTDPSVGVGVSNEQLVQLAEKGSNTSSTEAVLAYAQQRDLPLNNDKFQAIYQLAQKHAMSTVSLPNREEQTKVLLALVDLAKQEQQKPYDQNPNGQIQLASLENNILKIAPKEAAALQATKPKESLMSLPMALALVGAGVGLICCSIACNDRRMAAR